MSLNAKYGLPGHGPLWCLFIRLQSSQLHVFCTLKASWLGELWLISKSTITFFLRLLSLKIGECLAQQECLTSLLIDSESWFMTQTNHYTVSERSTTKMVTKKSHAEGSLLDLMDLVCSLVVPVMLCDTVEKCSALYLLKWVQHLKCLSVISR